MLADSLGLLLKAFRLPTMAEMYERVVQQAEATKLELSEVPPASM